MRIPVLAKLGKSPISLKTVSQVIEFWAHVITSDVDWYARKTYSDMTEHQPTDKDQWLCIVINILQGLGMTRVWGSQFTLCADILKRVGSE